jgi:hypothetical protein
VRKGDGVGDGVGKLLNTEQKARRKELKKKDFTKGKSSTAAIEG